MEYELGIIGAGNMAEAIVRGVIQGGVIAPAKMVAADVSPQRRELFANQLGIKAVEKPADAARGAKIVLLSVKPYQMGEVLGEIRPSLRPDSLVVSIAAGIGSGAIEKHLGNGSWRVVRSMPNTPMLVGEGMVAIAAGKWATPEDMATARRLFETAASVVEVKEEQMDAVTAVSGSGPAYFYYLVEQMTEAGVRLGLSTKDAELMARKTALGAAKLLVNSTDSPRELRRKVTTPGGTTAAAIDYMESHQMGQIVMDALSAAAQRSREMGK
ncbi:MAG: pyrroline-5-carboxylate reductase [Phycisphaerales bacterium]|jgi:pyrroline-5-carboxylate reductase|nr:pyrroline-5-carboxylate reductase [Phycisphaerales bacterium]